MLQLLTNFAQVHTDETREFAQDVIEAMHRSHLSQKAAAHTMEQSEQQLSHQLAGRQGLSLWKLAKLPWSFQIELYKIRLARVGYDVIAPGELQALIAGVREALPKRMAKMKVGA